MWQLQKSSRIPPYGVSRRSAVQKWFALDSRNYSPGDTATATQVGAQVEQQTEADYEAFLTATLLDDGLSRSASSMFRNSSARTRSATPLTISAPS